MDFRGTDYIVMEKQYGNKPKGHLFVDEDLSESIERTFMAAIPIVCDLEQLFII